MQIFSNKCGSQCKPCVPDTQKRKARLDHLLGVEFTTNEGVAAGVGSPYQDHARVSFAVKIGKSRPKSNEMTKKK